MKPLPETRIRVVEEYKRIRYYPEYKIEFIPRIWVEWRLAKVNLGDSDCLLTQEEAEKRIDDCITWWKKCRIEDEERSIRKKQGKRVWFIKYPKEDNK